MVGLRRTNACATCRRRKVKCDEVRPVCGQCAKKDRACEVSHPPELIWVKSKESRLDPAAEAPKDLATTVKTTQMIEACKLLRLPDSSELASHNDQPYFQRAKDDFHCHVKQAIELRRISHSPNMLPLDHLRCRFISAYEGGPVGLRLSTWSAPWIEIPRHLGSSTTMDDAVDCLLRTHSAFSQSFYDDKSSGDNLHFPSYHKALRSLQSALSDVGQNRESTTLCAIAMLCSAESLGRKGVNYDYVKHSGGITAFMKAAGPACAQDGLGKAMIATATGLMIVDAYMNEKRSLLEEPEWFGLHSDIKKSGFMQLALTQSIAQSSSMCSLLVEIREAIAQQNAANSLQDIFVNAVELRKDILQSRAEVDRLIQWGSPDKCLMAKRNSTCIGSPMPTVNWFPERFTAQTVLYSWTMLIQINDILDRLDSNLRAIGAGIWPHELAEEVRKESKEYSLLIFGSIEYAKSLAPMGSGFLSYPICVAWPHAPEEWKDWMLRELNNMTGPMTSCYRREILDYASERFAHWKFFSQRL